MAAERLAIYMDTDGPPQTACARGPLRARPGTVGAWSVGPDQPRWGRGRRRARRGSRCLHRIGGRAPASRSRRCRSDATSLGRLPWDPSQGRTGAVRSTHRRTPVACR